jgi:hypothetical protein
MIEQLRLRERPGGDRFPQSWFTVEVADYQARDLPAARKDVIVGRGARSDLGVLVVSRPGGLRLVVESSSDILEPARVREWMDRYRELLRRAVADPDAPVVGW